MGLATIDLRYATVLKDYKDHPGDGAKRWANEMFAYEHLSFATPEILCAGEYWLEMERLTPILEMTREQSAKYREPLRELLSRIHEAGYWHGDCALLNVVVHPVRGPLLVDWENLMPVSSDVSYDLYGARAAGVPQPWPVEGGDGVWWGGPWDMCPGPYWGEVNNWGLA